MKKLFINFIFVLFTLVLTVTSVFAENIKFVQLTDAHLDAKSEFSVKVLKAAIEDINNQPDIAFVVFGGDNVNSPKEENVIEFANIIKNLKVPYYVVLGNHDVYKNSGLSKSRYYEILKNSDYLFKQNKSNYKFSKAGFDFLLVDGAKEVIPNQIGYYRKDTLDWVDKQLTKEKNGHVVIIQHFPIVYPKGSESRLKTHRTYKVEDYANIINKHDNVLAILSGHFHINDENMSNGVYHISTPSIINLPYSYKIVDIVLTKDFSPIIFTQLKEFNVD